VDVSHGYNGAAATPTTEEEQLNWENGMPFLFICALFVLCFAPYIHL
jgi:hypothetical protein